MSATVRVFVNERPVEVAAGETIGNAVRRQDPGLAAALEEGTAYVTDGVGRRIDPASPVAAGSIIRVVRSARALRDQGHPA